MTQRIQFRKSLPVLQTALAILFGGWGLWLRNSILSRPFLGSSTGWDSTLSFHEWPWLFKFATIVNMPAFLIGSFLSWPSIPSVPEWVSTLPVLLFIPLLWFWVGSWLDKGVPSHTRGRSEWEKWSLLSLFIAVCALASSIVSASEKRSHSRRVWPGPVIHYQNPAGKDAVGILY